MTHPTGTLIHELGRTAQDVEIELVDATHKAERGGKPGSRIPTNPAALSDLDDAWRAVSSWVGDWLEFFDLHHPPQPTWREATDWLALHWPNAEQQHPAAQDFWEELFHRHTAHCRNEHGAITCGHMAGHLWRLRIHLGIEQRTWTPFRPFTCPVDDCQGQLLVHATEYVIRCPRCGEHWAEADYERLGLLLGCDPKPIPLKLAADRSGIPERTLRHWVHLGITPATRDGRNWLIDIRDVYAMTNRTEGN